MRSYDLETLRNQVAVVLQKNILFSGTVKENLRWGNKNASDEELKEACRLACADEFISQFPDGYDTYIEQGGANVSGGQKQRVAIAGVVAMRPSCIVLDEPTAMLDPNGRREVLEAVSELNQKENVTVILITHYMEEVIHANKVYVMDRGNVVMQGNPKEIFSQVDTLKAYGLDVPQVTLLAYELKKSGVDVPDGILTTEELVSALCPVSYTHLTLPTNSLV